MKKEKVRVGFIMLIMIFTVFSCNSKSGNNSGEAGFFGSTSRVEKDRLNNQLSGEVIDSVDIVAFLNNSEYSNELKETYLKFYQSIGYQASWVDEDGLSSQGIELLEAIETSFKHGLNPEDYKLAYLLHLKKKLDQEGSDLKSLQKIDKELTAAYLQLANHLLRGRIEPATFDILWLTDRREKDIAQHLINAIEEDEVLASLQALEPQYQGYKELKEALALYEHIATKQKEWPSLPKSLKLSHGDSSRYLPVLSQMLYALGDMEKPQMKGMLFDESLAGAVASFQERNGLVQDSILAEETIKMLNISPAQRVVQIKLNLERYRWLPERPESRFVVVNIPEYMVSVNEGDEKIFEMKVIVGEAFESTTPVFNDTMEYITFSPTWTVPSSIASGEMLPKLRNDPDYLVNRDFRLYESWALNAEELDARQVNWKKVKKEEFPFKIVQNPGKTNSLGRVKFMFPNDLDIYLHDTPADYLFNRNERDFSHGCIRVEKPVEFAEYLLQDQNIDRATIEEQMDKPEPVEVPLLNKVPVMIDYRTAWVGPNGKVHFREDIYGHDKTQMGTLNKVVADAEK